MINRLITYATVIAIGLTFTASVQSAQAREHLSPSHALHHVQPDEWSTAPTRNWYGPGEYDRLMNGSDASTPGHN